jgi:hypothetical protein
MVDFTYPKPLPFQSLDERFVRKRALLYPVAAYQMQSVCPVVLELCDRMTQCAAVTEKSM